MSTMLLNCNTIHGSHALTQGRLAPLPQLGTPRGLQSPVQSALSGGDALGCGCGYCHPPPPGHFDPAMALIVATHMEDLNHWTLSRQELRDFARRKGFLSQLRTPANGERIFISPSQILDPA